MGHALSIVDDAGNTLVTLINDNRGIIRYKPETAEPGQATIVERPEFIFDGSTMSDIQTPIRATEKALLDALERKNSKTGTRIYLQLLPHGESDVYRAELFGGRVDLPDNIFDEAWAVTMAEPAIVWERAAEWEGPEAEIALTNGSGSGTGGRAIKNHDDAGGGDDNYVQFTSLAGSARAPLRLEITNTSSPEIYTKRVHIALGAKADVANLVHILEGESSTLGSQAPGGSDTTLYSGGFYRTNTWATDVETDVHSWALSTSLLNDTLGQPFKIFARFTSAPTNIQARVALRRGAFTLAKSPQRTLTADLIQEIGTLRLPPTKHASSYPLTLVLTGQKTGGGTLAVDFLAFMPGDGYRLLEPLADGIGQNATLVDDQILGELYTTNWSTAGLVDDYAGYGDLLVYPDKTQRLYFLVTTPSGALIGQPHAVRAYYRPRRRTI